MSLALSIDLMTQGAVLSETQASAAFEDMMQGRASDADITRFLTLLHERGETTIEITAAAKSLRRHVIPIMSPPGTIDCCGTGGDGLHSLNISTAVALVVASCGIPVAKHGNRAATSKSGAADVLEALGVNLTLPPKKLEMALRTLNFCFLMAPNHHPAMKHVSAARKSLGHRSIFNLLGPLANPAGARRQLLGVYDKKWLRPMAEVLHQLGTDKAWVVHAANGMDEISLSGETFVAKLDHGKITETIISPYDFNLPQSPPESIKGGDAQENAAALMELLNGTQSAYRDIVLANAAAALVIADNAPDLFTGVKRATIALDNGQTLKLLEQYRDFSREEVPS